MILFMVFLSFTISIFIETNCKLTSIQTGIFYQKTIAQIVKVDKLVFLCLISLIRPLGGDQALKNQFKASIIFDIKFGLP